MDIENKQKKSQLLNFPTSTVGQMITLLFDQPKRCKKMADISKK